MALANAFKEGDLPIGGTRDDQVREEARAELRGTRAGDVRRALFVADGVTAMLDRGRDRSRDAGIDPMTIGELATTLLGRTGPAWAAAHRHCIASEVAAAVVKVMTDGELATVSSRLFNPAPAAAGSEPHGLVAIGSAGHFGSRIQPNSPGDDEEEILWSILEGLTYGCGDVILGLNPAADELDTIVRLEALLERVVRGLRLPTRFCVLSDIVKQHQALARTRVDVGFQSLAGTSSALRGMVGLDADGLLDLARRFDGLYFETGQGSAVTNGAAEGVDMVTLEARAYGVARHLRQQTDAWTIVNDVAGFIGPEVFRTPAQLERACLEDLVMAKLHGLTMGLDVCATFHMGIDPAALRTVTERVVVRGAPAYLMAVAGNADPMLGYMTTSFRDHVRLRQLSGRTPASPMEGRLRSLGATDAADLYAALRKAEGDTRTAPAIAADGRRRLARVREKGFDLGADARASEARLDAIYRDARSGLYASLDEGVLADVCPRAVRVTTMAADRDAYLSYPPAGEQLCDADAGRLQRLYALSRPGVQIVVSDGLNGDAINEQLRLLLPPVRQALAQAGLDVGAHEVVIRNGRVRAGYHAGALILPDIIIHIIGERPGTGLGTVSAYLTYGRDEAGASRWAAGMDHAMTSAVCGIHRNGKHPEAAAAEISRTVARMYAQRRSGVALR